MHLKTLFSVSVLLFASLLAGCATQNNKDPLEGLNRAVYKFNDVGDKAVVKPIAGAYKAVIPSPVRGGVSNFFNNIRSLISAINGVLQLKFDKAANDFGRFAINSTFGIAGLVDVAAMDGLGYNEMRMEDFGQTLGRWGVGSGPYLVLPFLGASSLRDGTGLAVDVSFFDATQYMNKPRNRNQFFAVNMLDKRARLLPGSDLLDEAALDPYAFLRDGYLQRRNLMVNDMDAAPQENDDDDSTP